MAVAGRATCWVAVALCLGSASGFCPGGAAPLPLRVPALLPRHAVVAVRDRARPVAAQAPGSGGGGDGGAGGSRLLDLLEFVIGTTFNSRLYVGSPELHVAVPLPQPDQYPAWMPTLLRLPQGVYGFVEKGVEEGWIKRAPADRVFEIKYGVMRGEVSVVPDDKCEPCELEKRRQLEQDAARDLVNIGDAERSRRTNTGYAILATSTLAGYLALDFDGGPWARFPAAFLAVLGYAFVESGKNGLWNVAQAGLWDVDGRGLVPIQDPTLRQALRDKVNAFDLELARKTTPYLLAFTFFPFGWLKSLF